MYNLSNLEPKFKNFLYAENISAHSIRNYLSDIRHFFGWLITTDILPSQTDLNNYFNIITPDIVEDYKSQHLASSLPVKTINRRLSALRKFFHFLQNQDLIKDNPAKAVSNVALRQKTVSVKKIMSGDVDLSGSEEQIKSEDMRFEQITEGGPHQRVSVCEKRHIELFSLKFFKYLSTSFLILISLLILALSLFKKPKIITPIVQAAPASTRYLAFKGRLSDKQGNPITTKTDVEFNLYNQPSGGDSVYTSLCLGQDQAITPDVNGNFRVLIGKDCDGKPISANIFLENPNLYLGITPGSDSELKPRQKIPNVGYALNSDTIGGLNLGTNTLSVPFINQDNDLIIEAENPAIHSISEGSNFTLSSTDSITLQAANLGDVVLQATDSGNIKLRTGGISDLYTRLLINSEGNIGIGTLFPSFGLEVNDDVKITDGNRLILGSSTSDPTGVNGSLYYNSLLNKFRCFQAGNWVDCFSQTEKTPIGGIYDGTLNQETTLLDLQKQINSLSSKIEQLNNRISALLSTNYQLQSTNISVREKINSPVVETAQVKTEAKKPRPGDFLLDLSSNNQDRTDAVGESDETSDGKTASVNRNKGLLASLIIKGLEGKTAATIDAAGNATFSGSLAAKEASISGKLTAKEIEAENINSIQQSVVSSQQEISKLTTNNRQLITNINDVQTLLSDIKNQPLPDPQYYQNLQNNQQFNNLTIEQLTVTGRSNLYNLTVSGSGTIGNLLIENNSILSLAWDLKLSALSSIKLFEDAVVISKDGNITTKGKLLAQAGIKTPKIEITDTAGIGTIALNTNEAIIFNKNIQDSSLIYLTPTTQGLSFPLTVSKKESCNINNNETMEQLNNEANCKPHFTVALLQPVDYNINFNWLIIN